MDLENILAGMKVLPSKWPIKVSWYLVMTTKDMEGVKGREHLWRVQMTMSRMCYDIAGK